MSGILLIGGGGHARVVIDAIRAGGQYEIVGILDLPGRSGSTVDGIPVIGDDRELEALRRRDIGQCCISVGSTGSSSLRIALYQKALDAGYALPNIVHPSAVVSPEVIMGSGNFVAAGAIINAGTALGCGCIINTSAVIEHDCKIGDFAHAGPGAILCGGVVIGRAAHIGAGSVVRQGLSIGEESVVGIGSAVVKNVRDRVTVCGVPCQEIAQKHE